MTKSIPCSLAARNAVDEHEQKHEPDADQQISHGLAQHRVTHDSDRDALLSAVRRAIA